METSSCLLESKTVKLSSPTHRRTTTKQVLTKGFHRVVFVQLTAGRTHVSCQNFFQSRLKISQKRRGSLRLFRRPPTDVEAAVRHRPGDKQQRAGFSPSRCTRQHALRRLNVLEPEASLMNNKHGDSKKQAFWGIPGPSQDLQGPRDQG